MRFLIPLSILNSSLNNSSHHIVNMRPWLLFQACSLAKVLPLIIHFNSNHWMILSKFVSEAKTISSRRELVQSPGLLMNWARLNRESEKCKKLLRDLNNWRSWKDIEKKDSTGRFNCMRSKDEKKKMKWRGIEILRIKDKSTSKTKRATFYNLTKAIRWTILKTKRAWVKAKNGERS